MTKTDLKRSFEGTNFEKLPKEVKIDILYLSKEIREQELGVLAPIVDQFVELNNKVKSAELTVEEDGKFSKDSVQEYKDIKRELGAFNSSMKKEIGNASKPYYDIHKKFVAVKKTLEENKNSLMDELQLTFKEYLDEEERKKKERERKKQEALEAELKAQQEEADQKKQEADTIMIFNTIKYDKVLGREHQIKEVCRTANAKHLLELHNQIKNEDIVSKFLSNQGSDFGFYSLNDERQFDIQKTYAESHSRVLTMLMEAYHREEEKAAVPVPEPPSRLKKSDSDLALYNTIVKQAEEHFLLTDRHIGLNENCNPVIYQLREQLRTIKNMQWHEHSN